MGRHSPSSRRHSPSSRRHSPSSHRNRNNRSISPPPPREKQHQPSSRAPRPASRSPDPPPSYHSRSPSPRTKRLKKNQSEREPKLEHNRSHGSSRGRDSERETVERKERRVENEDDGVRNGRSSRSRHERSPENHRNGRSRHKSRSPPYHPAQTQPRDEVTNSRGAEMMNEEDDSIMKMKAAEEALEEKQKVKPSFELSGKLAAETNRVRGITLLFNEPPEARKPDIKWRLYVFKTGEMLNEPLYIHRQSCYLFGRERRVADVPTDHPSCSKQHAVIQFRQIEKEQPDGTSVKQTRPYIMDLGSTNKTFVNDNPIEPQRYYELREQDTIKFGNSSREYVLLHENSAS